MADMPVMEFMVPVRNSARHLAECLHSILDQTERRIAVHVVDDGSTDASPAIVGNIKDPRLFYHRFEDPVSLPGNFNRCIDLATAPFFALIHADDRVMPGFASAMLSAADRYPDAALVFCKGAIINDSGERIRPMKQRIKNWIHDRRGPILEGQAGLEQMASYNHLMCPCAIYRKALLPPEMRYPEGFRYLTDQSFWLTALALGAQIAQISATHYEHRVHDHQLSATLRAAGSTLDEVRRFQPAGPDPVRLNRIWQRYGAKLALRMAIISALRGRGNAALSGLAEMSCFIRAAQEPRHRKLADLS